MIRHALAVLVPVVLFSSCATPQLGGGDLPARPPSLRAAFDVMPDGAEARVRILDDNVDAWVARFNAIESATTSIDVQYFILDPDAYGLAMLGQLAEKARRGVKVRLMIDARGAFGTIRGAQRFLLQEVQRAGVDARVYNPMLFQMADVVARGDLRTVTASNHDKMVIVDGRLAIAGGRNLSQDYLADPRDRPAGRGRTEREHGTGLDAGGRRARDPLLDILEAESERRRLLRSAERARRRHRQFEGRSRRRRGEGHDNVDEGEAVFEEGGGSAGRQGRSLEFQPVRRLSMQRSQFGLHLQIG